MRRTVRTICVLLTIAAASVSSAAFPRQSPAPGGRTGDPAPDANTALILGRVLDATSGQPIAGALVSLGAFQSSASNAMNMVVLGNVGVLPADLSPGQAAMTDGRGVFLFRDLPAGRFNITVRTPGYLPGAYGQRRPDGSSRSLVVGDRQTIADAEIRLWKAASISGTIFDELGEPVVEVPVRALRRAMVRGRVKLVAATTSRTDDRGIYRLGSLIPGEYVVVMPSSVTSIPASVADLYLEAAGSSDPAGRALLAEVSRGGTAAASGGVTVGDQRVQTDYGRALAPTPRGADDFAVYPIVFHPTAYAPQQAATVTLASGDEREGIDLRTALVRTYRVSGTLTGPEGPLPNASVRMMPTYTETLASDAGFTTSTTSTDAQGRFTLIGITPGDYVVRASRAGFSGGASVVRAGDGTFMVLGGETVPAPGGAPGGGEMALSGEAPVSIVDSHVTGLAIALQPGVRIAGRLEFAGSETPPTPVEMARTLVTATRVDGQSVPLPRAAVDRTGTFTVPPYPPGAYLLSSLSPRAGWFLKSVVIGGRDATHRAVDLTRDLDGVVISFVDRLGEVSGRAGRGSGADGGAAVALFPADYQEWIASGMAAARARLVDAGPDGAFEMPAILADNYLLAAVEASTPVDLQDPRDIEALARVATRLTLGDAEQRTVTLSISRLR